MLAIFEVEKEIRVYIASTEPGSQMAGSLFSAASWDKKLRDQAIVYNSAGSDSKVEIPGYIDRRLRNRTRPGPNPAIQSSPGGAQGDREAERQGARK